MDISNIPINKSNKAIIIMSYMNNKGIWGFIGGILIATIGTKIAKSPTTRKLTVQGLSKAMLIQQKAMEQLANIREEAQDLCHEASEKNRKSEK